MQQSAPSTSGAGPRDPDAPALSVVVLSWNEERNIGALLASLARQRRRDFELIVIDAASTDRTVERVHEAGAGFPVPLRLDVAPRRIPIGEARNRGVALARAPLVAFLSADAEPEHAWTQAAVGTLRTADMVFGPQTHAPHRWSVAAAVRGLRYRFPDAPPPDPLPYASNVAAAYRKDVLVRFPFDPAADAAEDLVLARRAAAAGFRVAYDADMVVRHHDVATAREELRKNLREGHAWGLHADELGVHVGVLAWGVALLLAVAVMALQPATGAALLVAALWAPALRRAFRRRSAMPSFQIAKGVAASPPFDLVFLVQYVRGLVAGRRTRARRARAKETRT